MTDETSSSAPPDRRRRSDRSPWYLLLLVPILLLVYPPLYNRLEPAIGGLPFFYWYQLAVVPVGVVCTLVVYRQTRQDRDGDRR